MLRPRLLRYGDRAWLVEYEPRAGAVSAAASVGLAAAIRRGLPDEVEDVVGATASVCVHVTTPAALERVGERLQTLLDALVETPPDLAADAGTLVEFPVVYGGDAGPDLEAVAAWAGLSAAEVVRRHTAPVYRVQMLGFLPGFPYLGTVDPAIQAPRHATPRTRVEAGSVGIAGPQTGIYPRESPGGWQIIGRTAEWLFDARRTPPARLSPGDRVRFVDLTAAARA